MRITRGVGVAAVVMLVAACSGKLASVGADGGEGDAQPGGGSSSGGGNVTGSSTGGVTGSSGASGGSSSSGIGSSSGPGSSSSGGSGSGSGGPFDAGEIDCGAIPILHENPPAQIDCGFDADGGLLECLDSFCCLGGSLGGGMYAPQICAPNAAGCMIPSEGTNPIPIQCNQVSDCHENGAPGATACCLQGATAPMAVPGCDYDKAKGGSAVVCEGSGGGAATVCAAGEVQVCSSNADCPMGTTCTAGRWKIYQLGFCM